MAAELLRKQVFLVDDDTVLRNRIAAHIESQSDMGIVGVAATRQEAMQWLEKQQPEVLLCDLGLPDGSGIDVISACLIRYPNCLVMVITVFGDDEHAFKTLEAGALGYILKDTSIDEIADQIRSLLAGGSPISPIIARRVLRRLHAGESSVRNTVVDDPDSGELSPREIEVLQYLSKGFSNLEVAKLFLLSPHTIATYIRRIYRKLAVHSRTEAVFEARKIGILTNKDAGR